MSAGAPSHRAHLVAVYEADVDQVVNSGHDVLVTLAEIIAVDFHLELLAVIGRASVIMNGSYAVFSSMPNNSLRATCEDTRA
jgi:hypothetical protein